MAKRFQNIVATSRYTLPAVAAYAFVALLAMGRMSLEYWPQAALLFGSTLLMVALNNRFSLIRIYGRLVSSSFLMLAVMQPSLLDSVGGGMAQALFIGALLLLFRSYQERRSMGGVFYAFACLGTISTQFFQIVLYVPLLWALMYTSLQIGSLRAVAASVAGFLLPYWFWSCYCLHVGRPELLLGPLEGLASLASPGEGLLQPGLLLTAIFVGLLGAVGSMHFLQNSSADNIKTRMFFNVLITLFIATMVLVVVQPQHSDFLMRFAIICVAPLVAHYFTFTGSWMTSLSFYGVLLATITLTILNAWIF